MRVKLFLILISSILLLRTTKTACNIGCLECNLTNETCKLCDFVHFYSLNVSEGSCELYDASTNNCELMSIKYKCIKCKANHFYVTSSNGCDPVPQENLIENCVEYASASECSACAAGFVVMNNSCLQIETDIPNCSIYKTALHCQLCEDGYIASLDETVCLKVPVISNCALYSFVDCINCKTGYVRDRSLYMYTQADYASSDESLTSIQNYLIASSGNIKISYPGEFSDVCDVERVGDCTDFINSYTCRTCKDNFLVNTKGDICLPFPETPIANCLEYSQVDECILCEGHYYVDIDDPSKCKKGEEIEFCKTYAVNDPDCLECEENYFIDGKECIKRVNSLIAPGCIKKNTHNDVCLECQQGFALLDNGTCASGILNCKSHIPGASNKDNLECERCKETFYYKTDTKTCLSGTDTKCKIFRASENFCEECKPGSFLSTNVNGDPVCKEHNISIENCETYSITHENKCEKCSSGFLLFQNRNLCATTSTPISRCEIYENATTCRVCENHFNGPNCDPIDSTLKCQLLEKGSSTKCELCKDGYFTNTYPFNNVCVQPYKSMIETCETFSLSDFSSRIFCDECQAAKFPVIFDQPEHFLCADQKNYLTLDEYCAMFEYDSGAGTYTCKMCKTGRVLGTSGSCDLDCGANEYLLMQDVDLDIDNQYFRLNGRNKCVSDTSLPNCKIAVQSLSEGSGSVPEVICGQCRSGFDEIIPISSSTVRVHNWDKAAQEFKRYQHNPEVNCKAIDVSKLIGTTDKTDCDKFYEVKTGFFSCAKCLLGLTGTVIEVTDTTLPISPIQVMQKCDVSIDYCLNTESDSRGITKISQLINGKQELPWESLITCFKCFGSETRIPFINFKWNGTRKIPQINAYNLAKGPIDNDVTDFSINDGHDPNGYAMSCLDYTIPADFGISPVNIPSFISNCAIGGFNLIGTETDSRLGNAFAVCIICEPGFEPIFLANSFVITECRAISYCGNSLVKNECTFCNEERIYSITDNSCIAQTIKDSHCLFGTASECYICEPGYSVTLDKLCEQIDSPNCESGYTFLPNGLRSDDLGLFVTISQQLSLGGGGDWSGCGQCSSGFLSISNLPLVSTICLDSEYLANDDFRTNTVYIENCLKLRYNYDIQSYSCSLCKSGYMPSFDWTRCVNQTASCLQAGKADDGVCNLCKTGYSLLNGKCQKNSINNCLSYYTDSEKIFCRECESGFVKDHFDLECTEGQIPNCSIFRVSDPLHCLGCKTGFKLIRNNLGRTICLEANQLNCEIWEDDNDFFCTQCSDGFHPKTIETGEPASSCIGGNFTIENCKILDSEFACSLCNDGYYLSKSRDRCIELNSPLLNCQEPMLDIAECKICEAGYYLKEDTRSCFPFPSGISNCIDYQNESTCSKCQTGFYLSENQCKEVSETILHCVTYLSNTICKTCEDGYSVNPSPTGPHDTCAIIQAQNCLTASDINTCSSCNPGYGLHHSNGSVDCESISSIPYCDKQDFNAPYSCLECGNNSVFADGICDPIVLPISNCEIYSSQNACKLCRDGYLLKFDGSSCDKIGSDFEIKLDSNCDSFLQDSRGFGCNACMPGHYLTQGGVCISVSTLSSEHAAHEHCAFFTDISKLKCQICRSGYNMDNLGICLKNNQITTTDSGGDDDDRSLFQSILMSFPFIMILSFLI